MNTNTARRRPRTSLELEALLEELDERVDTLAADLDQKDIAAVNAREAYVEAYAVAFITSPGPMDIRKQLALQVTHDVRLQAELADQVVRGLIRHLRILERRIETTRTRSANVRAEASLARTGTWGA